MFKYYNVHDIIDKVPDAQYYVIYGERSNGKTYSCLRYALENHARNGEQFAYVRRFNEDIRSKYMSQLFAPHIKNHVLRDLYPDVVNSWNGIKYSMGKFHLIHYGDTKKEDVVDERPAGFSFDLHGMEHSKGNGYPDVTTIIFDEFMSRQGYLPNEVALFINTVSTIVRDRDNVKIFMLGNTVNKYSPYFESMGLTHVIEQKQGTIETYTYGTSKLKVACEFCKSSRLMGGKKSDDYFAFDNPALSMITSGAWETAQYPGLHWQYKPKDIITKFFVEFNKELIQGDMVIQRDTPYVFMHRRTRPIRDEDGNLLPRYRECMVYTDKPRPFYNERMAITKQNDRMSRTLLQLVNANRFYYSDNWIGEIWRNYLKWSNMISILN